MSYTVRAGKPAIKLSDRNAVTSVLQNVAIILATPKGSVPLYREFGLSMDFVDKPMPVARTLLVSAITEAIHEFEPRAEVVGISFETDENAVGRLVPIVEVEVLNV